MERLSQEFPLREDACRMTSSVDEDIGMVGARLRHAEAGNDERMSQLARTIEQEIIPRLMLAHRVSLEPMLREAVQDLPITAEDIEQFSKLVLSLDEDAAYAAIETLRERGMAADRILVELLAPTARHLGHLWDEDLCSFTDVTVGLGRLQRVLRELSSGYGREIDHPTNGRRALLMPGPGEQHTFGLSMVGEIFRRAGWDVAGGAWATDADVTELVAVEWFDVVGFSVGSQSQLSGMAETIAAVRRTACNHHVVVLVGGPLFALHPEYLDGLDADGMTIDGREAPALAEKLIDNLVRRHGLLA